MNQNDTPRPASLVERLRDHSLAQRLRDDPPYRKRFGMAVGGGFLALVLLLVWIGRAVEHSEMRRVLNEQAAFHDPALGIMFPQVINDTPEHRALLAAGEELRFWVIRPMSQDASRMEVRVTDTGRRMFTPVGNQILATFGAGAREVTSILGIEGGDQTRQVRFRYRWTQLHPGVAILGETAPAPGEEYEGEALFSFENEEWRVVHWTTPLEDAIARFREMGNPTSREP